MRKLARRGRALPLAVAAYVAQRGRRCLGYAHDAHVDADGKPLNIIHRDVSPSNIMVPTDGRREAARLRHRQGARRGQRRARRKHGLFKGKLAYVSPEQIEARRSTAPATCSRWASCCGRCWPAGGCSDGNDDRDADQRAVEAGAAAVVPEAGRAGGAGRHRRARAGARSGLRYATGQEMADDLEEVLRATRSQEAAPRSAARAVRVRDRQPGGVSALTPELLASFIGNSAPPTIATATASAACAGDRPAHVGATPAGGRRDGGRRARRRGGARRARAGAWRLGTSDSQALSGSPPAAPRRRSSPPCRSACPRRRRRRRRRRPPRRRPKPPPPA